MTKAEAIEQVLELLDYPPIDIDTRLDVLWSTAYSEGHAAGKEEAWIESGKDF